MKERSAADHRRKFKNRFNEEAAFALADQIAAVYDEFDVEQFVRLTTRGLGQLDFKARVQRFAKALLETLPAHIPTALGVLIESLPEALPDDESTAEGWLQWPLGEFISLYCREYPEDALIALEELTQRFSAEFAVRPFVHKYPDMVFEYLLEMTTHPSAHVRRWCAEGIRPRLPWGLLIKSLQRDPSPILTILDQLKDDPDTAVRRSVANNLNDIAKDHPELVVEVCEEWAIEATEERQWVIGHALRSLIKAAHPGALALQGFHPPPPELQVNLTVSPRTLVIGETVEFAAILSNGSSRALRLQVDFVLHYVQQKNKTSGKVFKWKALDLEPGRRITLKKEQAMLESSVRALFPGRHKVELQVNGAPLAEGEFNLL